MSSSDNRNCRTGNTASAIAGIFGPAMSVPLTIMIIDRLLAYPFGQDKMSENIKKRGVDKKSDTTSDRSRRVKSFTVCLCALISMLLFNADGSLKIYMDFNKMSQDTTFIGSWHVGITIFSMLDVYVMMGLIFDNIMVGTFNSNDLFQNNIFTFMTKTRFTLRDRDINNLTIIRIVQWITQTCLWILTVFYMPLEFTSLDTENNKFIVGAIQIVFFLMAYAMTVVPVIVALIYLWRNVRAKNKPSENVELKSESEDDKPSTPRSAHTGLVKSASYKKMKIMYVNYIAMFILFLIFTVAGAIQIGSCILRMIRILVRYPLVGSITIAAENNYLCNTYTFIKRRLLTYRRTQSHTGVHA